MIKTEKRSQTINIARYLEPKVWRLSSKLYFGHYLSGSADEGRTVTCRVMWRVTSLLHCDTIQKPAVLRWTITPETELT